jgi:hypothetical protein
LIDDALAVRGRGRRGTKRGTLGELGVAHQHIRELMEAIESARSFHFAKATLLYHPDLAEALRHLDTALEILRRNSKPPIDFLPRREAGGKRLLRIRFPEEDEFRDVKARDIVRRLARLLTPMAPSAPSGAARDVAQALIQPLLPPDVRRGRRGRTRI